MLRNYALENPNQEAIVSGDFRINYREYDLLTNSFAHFLLDQGIKKGDRVALITGVNGAFPLSQMAIAKIGAMAVPINYMWKPELIEWSLEHAEPKLILCADQFYGIIANYVEKTGVLAEVIVQNGEIKKSFLEELTQYPDTDPLVEVKPDDPFSIVFTSGTTSRPKGVVATQNAFFSIGIACTPFIPYGGRCLLTTPLFHISGFAMNSFQPFLGLTMVYLNQIEPNALLKIIEDEKINITFLPPPLLGILLPLIEQSDSLLPSLQTIISGGSKVPQQVHEAYRDLGIEITEVLGSTESCGVISHLKSSMNAKVNTVGRAYLYPYVKVLDPETREEVPQGEVGELAVKGPNLFKEYWRNPELTEKAFHDGWFLTGDAVRLDENGFIEVVDRYKNVIYFSGFGGVFPATVEKVIREIPDVKDVAVIGIDHVQYGEFPCGFVQVDKGSILTKREVFEYVHSKLERHNLVEVIISSDPLPRNANGKIDKVKLKEIYQRYQMSAQGN